MERALLLLLCPAISSASWQHEFLAPTAFNLSAVATSTVSNRVVIVAAGERGTLVRPSNLGSVDGTWITAETRTESWLRDIDVSGGRWVAVGDEGVILSSTDATSWRRVFSPVAADWVGVARGSGLWCILSTAGHVITVDDKEVVTLKATAGAPGRFFTSVHYAAGLYMAAGAGGALYVSTNLGSWTDRSLPTQDTVSHLFHADGRWLATAGTRLWISADGLSWTSTSPGGGSTLTSVGYARGAPGRQPLWMAVGYGGAAFYSTNLLAWSRLSSSLLPTDLADVRIENGTWVAVGNRGAFWYRGETRPYLLSAEDQARFWFAGNFPAPATNTILFSDITTMDGDGAVALAMGSPGKSIRIADSEFNKLETTGIDGWIAALRHADGKWVAVGDSGGIYTSTNSVKWTAIPPTYRHEEREKGWVGTTRNLMGVDHGSGTWICVGEGGMIRVSRDKATNWSPAHAPFTEDLFDVRFSGGRWIAVGENESILRSTNGLDWERIHYTMPVAGGSSGLTNRPFPPQWEACFIPTNAGPGIPVSYRARTFGNALRSVDWGGGRWVAVGDGGRLFTSSNSVYWVAAPPIGVESLYAVRYSTNGWRTVGEDGVTFSSSDGLTWEKAPKRTHSLLSALRADATDWLSSGVGSVILVEKLVLPFDPPTRLLTISISFRPDTARYEAVVSWPAGIEGGVLRSDTRLDGSFGTDHNSETLDLGDRLEVRMPLERAAARFFKLTISPTSPSGQAR